jgi:hypothetical protein
VSECFIPATPAFALWTLAFFGLVLVLLEIVARRAGYGTASN